MTDHFDLSPPDRAPPPHGQGRLLAAGVVSAVVLGVGLGLWARPAPPTGAQPMILAPEDAPRPALQIVFDDTPAPLGPLLDVLPGDAAPALDPPPPSPEMAAPRRPAAGLMKVDAVVVDEPPPVPARKVAPKPAAEPKSRPKVDKPPRTQTAQAKAKPKAERPKVAVAKPKPKPADKPKAATKLAKVEKPTKAEKAKAAKLAQATAKRETALKAKAEARRVAALAKASKAAKAEAAKRKTQLAAAKAQKTRKIEKASVKTVVAKAPAPKPPATKRPSPVGQGPLRVARNDACASPDPGQAVVCADRRLGARDRQLQRAYRDAEAAGVPASALQRQQARWLQARAAAAREAPWAVEDVYEARISELNDLTRDARRN